MNKSMHALLDHARYKPESDVLIHVGDIIAKGTHSGSMSVLSYMALNNITGVRGNHDQKVIEWRTWLEWIRSLSGGEQWLEEISGRWVEAQGRGVELKEWIKQEKKKGKKWWGKVPKGWKLFGDHFEIARAMTRSEYEYLLSLPLVLHIPSAHTFIAHAGILSSDPNYEPSHHRQPLSHLPSTQRGKLPADIPLLRRLQEEALLREVPQNQDPWVVLNMRSILKDNTISRKNKGTPWSDHWNSDVASCEGFETDLKPKGHQHQGALLCHPATVIYGHAASRGLDPKRWSIGLDSGCTYNRRLTGLVLGPSATHFQIEGAPSIIPFGDDGEAHIVSVTCK